MLKYIYQLILLLFICENITAQSNVDFLGQYKNQGEAGYSDVWGYVDNSGNEYALLCGHSGTYVVNVSNPSNPNLISYFPGPDSRWKDVKTHGNYAYVVSEIRGNGEGLQIIDLSGLPNSAKLVKTITTDFITAHNLFINDGYAYVVGTDIQISGDNGMYILDLSDPTNPVKTSYYGGSGYIHDVYVWNDTAVVSAATTFDLVDLKDKSNPVKISASAPVDNSGAYAHAGWMTEDKRYFIATDEFNAFDIRVYDLQDRSTWEVVLSQWHMQENTRAHNLFVKGNYAHMSYYEDGYVVLDISDPLNPKLVGHYDTYLLATVTDYKGAWGCYPYLPSGNTLISDIDEGLFVLKFNEPNVTFVNEELPSKFRIDQNYPNPFNPSTKISFQIPQREFVGISVYNVLGENVANLLNKTLNAGEHSIEFNANGLESGVYFARIIYGNKSSIIKMNLIK